MRPWDGPSEIAAPKNPVALYQMLNSLGQPCRNAHSKTVTFMQFSRLKAAVLALVCACPGFTGGAAVAQEGVSKTEVTFVQVAAMTGSAASLGQGMQQGILAAFDEVNRNGGVHGRMLRLETIDDGYDPAKSVAALRAVLARKDRLALIGATGTPTLAAMQPIATAAGMPIIGPFTGADFLRNAELGNVFNLRASYAAEAEEWVRILVDERGLSRIAVFYQDDSFGRAGRSGLIRALQKRNLSPVGEGTYIRNTKAVKAALLDIRRSKPEAVVLVAAAKPLARFVDTARSLDFQPQLIAISFGADAMAKELGADGAGILMTQVVPLPEGDDLPVIVQFRAALASALPKEQPTLVNLEGYLVGLLAVRALQDAGAELTQTGYLDALRALRKVELGGLDLNFSETDNQGLDRVFLTRIDTSGVVVAVKNGS